MGNCLCQHCGANRQAHVMESAYLDALIYGTSIVSHHQEPATRIPTFEIWAKDEAQQLGRIEDMRYLDPALMISGEFGRVEGVRFISTPYLDRAPLQLLPARTKKAPPSKLLMALIAQLH